MKIKVIVDNREILEMLVDAELKANNLKKDSGGIKTALELLREKGVNCGMH